MSDPRFFRRYLDILDEQEPTSATVNFDDTTSLTANAADKTLTAKSQIGDLNLKATKDLTNVGALSASGDYQISPKTSVGVTQTQTGFKGQMAPSSQLRGSHTDDQGQVHNLRVDKGVGFGGAGKDIQPGQNIQTTYTRS